VSLRVQLDDGDVAAAPMQVEECGHESLVDERSDADDQGVR
jgi:hypothetical protein